MSDRYSLTITSPTGETWDYLVNHRVADYVWALLRRFGCTVLTTGIEGRTQARHGELT